MEPIQLLKYEGGSQYHAHHDHSSKNSRILSLVACFGDDFEGGELEFPFFNKTIKLEKNSLILVVFLSVFQQHYHQWRAPPYFRKADGQGGFV